MRRKQAVLFSDFLCGPIQTARLRRSVIGTQEPKNFCSSGAGALATGGPNGGVQSKKSFFASFCSQKEVLKGVYI
jgi:hypothetical protein